MHSFIFSYRSRTCFTTLFFRMFHYGETHIMLLLIIKLFESNSFCILIGNNNVVHSIVFEDSCGLFGRDSSLTFSTHSLKPQTLMRQISRLLENDALARNCYRNIVWLKQMWNSYTEGMVPCFKDSISCCKLRRARSSQEAKNGLPNKREVSMLCNISARFVQ